jgi:hypothetical protein
VGQTLQYYSNIINAWGNTLRLALPVAAFCLLFGMGSARADVLITAEEAARPNAVGPAPLLLRSISRPPEAILSSSAKPGDALKSPLLFAVKFVAHGGAKINKSLVRIFYLKSPSVDLVPRIQAHLDDSGINMPGAEVPPGEHRIVIELTDTAGKVGQTELNLVVAR